MPEEKLSKATFFFASPGANLRGTISGAVFPISTRSGTVINGRFSPLAIRNMLEFGIPTFPAASMADLTKAGCVRIYFDLESLSW